MKLAGLLIAACGLAHGHDIITTPITWSHEISSIFEKKCVSCHRPGGTSFDLTTYKAARPWVVAIREETLARTMPPWGAVKGFGDFANDISLTPEDIELIVKWSEGGVPEGDDTKPMNLKLAAAAKLRTRGALNVIGDVQLKAALRLGAIVPVQVPDGTEFQLTAEFPDGELLPLVWLKDYNSKYTHPFVLRTPLALPAGTWIRGVPRGAMVQLVRAR